MKVEYLRTSRKSYMIVKNADYIFENYELQMILHNDIPSLLEIQVIMGDGAAEYWYDVTGMQSLQQQFSVAPIRERQLRFLLQNLIELKKAMEEYLLDDQNICFSASMIYYDRFTDRIRFCYIPGLARHSEREIRNLFEEILQYLDHSDVMAVQMGYDMYERCVQSEFIIEDCVECLTTHISCGSAGMREENDPSEQGRTAAEGYGCKNGAVDKEDRTSHGAGELPEERETELEFLQADSEKKRGHRRRRRKEKRKNPVDYSAILDQEQRNFYAAEEILGEECTECLSEDNTENQWMLIYKGDGLEQDMKLTVFPYLIGTDREKVQGLLQSRTVSRIHAKLFLENGSLYLEDYNSTNGTYLNHRLLPMNTPCRLQAGDRVVFATEEFQVYCRRIPKQD